MPNVIEGSPKPPQGRFAIVAARFNEPVVRKLVDGALSALRQRDVADNAIDVAWVPGSFEIPLVAKRLASSGRYLAVVCLGAVIRGDTDHYEHVCNQAAAGVLDAGLTTGVPVMFGILTCQTEEQAWDRAGGKEGNKGFDTALAAMEMANLMEHLKTQ